MVIVTGLLWYKIFYWLRIFEYNAFYINLLYSTFRDIVPFTIIFVVVNFAYANMLYLINGWKMETESVESIYGDEIKSNTFFHSLIYSYNVTIGNINTGNFVG